MNLHFSQAQTEILAAVHGAIQLARDAKVWTHLFFLASN